MVNVVGTFTARKYSPRKQGGSFLFSPSSYHSCSSVPYLKMAANKDGPSTSSGPLGLFGTYTRPNSMGQVAMVPGHGGRLSVRTDCAGRPIGGWASRWLHDEEETLEEARGGQNYMERVDGLCCNLLDGVHGQFFN